MEITSTTLIIVGVICIVLGFFASVLLNTLRDDESQPIEDDVQAPPGGKKGRYLPVVRLWRERKSGLLVVEADGRSFISSTPLNDLQREEMERIAREFRGWLGMGMTNPASGSEPQAMAEPVPLAPFPASSPKSNLGRPPVVPTSSPSLRNPAVVPPAQAAAALSVPASSGPKSIVMQIEDILQDMISNGQLANRTVHLYEDPLRGVMVSVGSEHYEGIDSVPDPTIKATIRAAVTEWERSQ